MFGRTACALCGVPLREGDAIFATSGCFLDEADPLARYCDAAMHWRCYAAWPQREPFARASHATSVESEPEDEYWDCVYADDALFITANPDEVIESTWVNLAETGSQIGIDFAAWVAFVTTGETKQELHELERDILARMRPKLAAALPTVEAVRAAAARRHAAKAR